MNLSLVHFSCCWSFVCCSAVLHSREEEGKKYCNNMATNTLCSKRRRISNFKWELPRQTQDRFGRHLKWGTGLMHISIGSVTLSNENLNGNVCRHDSRQHQRILSPHRIVYPIPNVSSFAAVFRFSFFLYFTQCFSIRLTCFDNDVSTLTFE